MIRHCLWKMSATPGACIKPGFVRRPLCHKKNLPSCVIARRPFCHKVNLPRCEVNLSSCVARRPLCHKVNLPKFEVNFSSCLARRPLYHKVNLPSCVAQQPLCHKVKGVINGPLKFLTARKILPLLDLLAKFKRVLACSCSPDFLRCSQARKANFLFLLLLAKKSQCSACSRMLAKTIRHP